MAKNSQGLPLAELTPGSSVNLSFQLKFNGNVQQFPAFRVPPGMSVLLYSVNGGAVNANGCGICEDPEGLGAPGGPFLSSARVIPAGADVVVPWAIDNLCQIFARGTIGDGLLAVLQLNQVG